VSKETVAASAPAHQLVGRMYHCNNCGWRGDRVAHCVATITGGQFSKDTIAISVCPYCTGLFSTLKRVFARETNPPNSTITYVTVEEGAP
jgi:hypothetical protein